MKKIMKFFAGVKKEMSKVRWPKKKEMINYSIATISFIVIFMLFFAGADIILGALVKALG